MEQQVGVVALLLLAPPGYHFNTAISQSVNRWPKRPKIKFHVYFQRLLANKT
jgi:hypothetical protein